MQEGRHWSTFGKQLLVLVWHQGWGLDSLPQSCTQREITSLQEKQTREDLLCHSFCNQPLGRLRATSKRSCRTGEVAMLSHTAFFLTPPELGLFCISLSSHKHLLQDGTVRVHSCSPNFMLHLVTISCYVVQRGITFDANTLLAVYKNNQCFLEPWNGSAGRLAGNRLYTSKKFQEHLLSSLCDLICDGTFEISCHIYNYLKRILSAFLREAMLLLPNWIDSLLTLTCV